jgi:archaetidylinositol phosphate synthase
MLKSRLRSEDTDRVLGRFSTFGLKPNAWTILSIIPALAGLIALISHYLAAGLILFALSGFMDTVDGAVARATNQTTPKGAFIDGVLDRYVELLLILGLTIYLGDAYFLLPTYVWMLLLLFGSLMTSFVRAYADHRGVVSDPEEQKMMGGLVERAERLMLLYAGMFLGLFDIGWMMAVIAITAVLANGTALQRILFALRRGSKR